MKTLLIGWLLVSAFAMGAETHYYLGEEILTDVAGKEIGRSPLLVEKISDPEKSLITETAINVRGEKCVQKFTSYLTLSGSHFTLKESTGTVTGEGDFVGKAWAWHYFKATFESSKGFRIEDENFMSDPKVLVARKKISRTTGELLYFLDATLHQIPGSLFTGLTTPLLKAGTSGCH